MNANGGTTPQSTPINTAFPNALAVTVLDSGSNPVSGANVVFTAPGSGASGTFSNSMNTITVATNASGVASAPFTANSTAGGPYSVTAVLGGLQASFALTNTVATISSVSPNSGNLGQTLTILVTGSATHFVNGTTTAFFGTGITINSVSVTSSTTANVNITIAPTTTLGLRTVTMTTGAEVATLTNGFTVNQGSATLVSATPNSGAQGASVSVAIVGSNTNFSQATTTASFGPNIGINSIVVTDLTHATVNITIAAGATVQSQTITMTTGGEIATLVNGFSITAGTPQITAVSPSSGMQGDAADSITITGQSTHFSQGTSVASFGSGITVTNLTVNNALSATATISIANGAAIGNRQVTITTGGEVANSAANAFAVTQGVPAATANPMFAVQGTTPTIVINGNAFTSFTQGMTTVTLPGGYATSIGTVTVNGSSQLSVPITFSTTAPIGGVNITVTTGTQVVQVPFTIAQGMPEITVINPNVGSPSSTLSVSISSNFTAWVNGTTTVSFGSGITVNSATVNSPTSLTANITIASGATLGPRNVVVTTGAEQETASQGFTVQTCTTTAAISIIYSPALSATDVPTNPIIQVQFNAPLNRSTVNTNDFYLDLNGVVVPSTVSVDASGRIVTLTPSVTLEVGHQYQIVWGNLGTGKQISDACGNLVAEDYYYFTTTFSTQTTGPSIIQTSPVNGDTALAENTNVVVQFNEPVNPITLQTGLLVETTGGTPTAVPGTWTPNTTYTYFTFVPSPNLAATTTYQLIANTNIQDGAGNALVNPETITFTTGSSVDSSHFSITSTDPYYQETNVGTGITPTVFFNGMIDPITVTNSDFYLYDGNTGRVIPTTFTVAANRLSATLTPVQPLQPNTYYYFAMNDNVQDLAGQYINGTTVYFYTGNGTGSSGTTVATISPTNGATGTPTNTLVVAVMSAPVDAGTITNGAITVKNGGTTVAGTVSLGTDYMTLTWTPAAALSVSTTYNVSVGGFLDFNENAVTTFTSSFTTGSTSGAVTGSFGATSVTPANGASGVSNSTQITITFARAVDPASLSNILVRDASASYYEVGGTWALNPSNPAQAIFTLTSGTVFPGSAQIQVYTQDQVKDLAGNTDNASVVTTFTIASTTDTSTFKVLSVSPANGATGVGRNATITITFNKSVNQSTFTGNALQLFVGDTNVGTGGISYSSDNRTVMFTPTTPANSTINIIATSVITDLSGNPLQNFQSQYSTSADISATGPAVVIMRPANAATDVPQTTSITLFTNGAQLNASTVNNSSLHVAENGVLVEGTIAVVGNNQAITFTPTGVLNYGALVQVYLEPNVLDIYGNPLSSFSAQFTVQGNPASVAPTLIAVNPPASSTGAPLNVIPQMEFDQPLLASSISSTSVRLYNGCTSSAVPGTLALTGPNNNVIQFTPSSALQSLCGASANYYYFQVNFGGGSNVTNLNGVNAPGESPYFYVGTSSVTTGPTVKSVAPPNAATGVGTNGLVIVQFSKPIDEISVNGSSIQITGASQTVIPASITFDSTQTYVTITPLSPFPASTQMTVTVSGVTDSSGNAVTTFTSTFTTGPGPITAPPTVINESPLSNATGVPTNATMSIQFSEPMALSSIYEGTTTSNSTFYVYDNVAGQIVPGTLSFSPDATTLYFVPSTTLNINRQYYYLINGAQDLTGNPIAENYWYFTTEEIQTSTVPQVVAVNPVNALTNIPTNTQPTLQFNEPINPDTLTGVTLSQGGTTVTATNSLSNGNTWLTITPAGLLQQNTLYTITVNGVVDYAGHQMTTQQTFTFTTGATSDITHGTVISTNPYYGETNVAINAPLTVYFSKMVNPLSITGVTPPIFVLRNNDTGATVATNVSIAANLLSATLTPQQNLQPNTYYYFQMQTWYDIAGNYGSGTTIYFYTGSSATTTGASVSSVSPPNGSTNAPVNTQVVAIMSGIINPDTVTSTAITVKNGATTVPGTTTMASDDQTLTWVPTSNLSTSTAYTVSVSGFQDANGNAVQSFSSSFTTGSSSTPYGSGSLTVVSVTPVNGSTLSSNTTPVVITFSHAVNPVTLNNILVRDANLSYDEVAGTWAVSGGGTIATFTPTSPYPANSSIQVYTQDQVKDWAGNTDNGSVVTTFNTANVADTTAPTVTSVTPSNGTTGVGQNVTVVLTFSKAVNPSTVTNNSVGLFAGDQNVRSLGSGYTYSISLAANNLSAIVTSYLPASTIINVFATSAITDLSGNALTPFQSQFTTGALIPPQSQGPQEVTMIPGNGATDIPQGTVITLYFNGSPLNASTINVNGGFAVSQNGQLVTGTATLVGNGHAIQFTPGSPLAYSAQIQVYAGTAIQDTYGNPLVSPFSGTFTIQGNPTSVAPLLVTYSPPQANQSTPLNVVPTMEFDQALASGSISATSVRLYNGCTATATAGTLALVGPNNNVIQFTPSSPLQSLCSAAANYYYFQVNYGGGSSVTNVDGVAVPGESPYFYMGTASDTTAPTVLAVGPPNGAQNVGINASIYVQFSKVINLTTANSATIKVTGASQTVIAASMSFSTVTLSNGTPTTIVGITPEAPLPPSATMTITINGVTDYAGNAVASTSTTFTTMAGPDLVAPTVLSFSYAANDVLPLNTQTFSLQFSKPMDPLSVNNSTLYLYKTTSPAGNVTPSSITFSTDMKTYTLNFPSSTLIAGDQYYVLTDGATDLAGNASGEYYQYFTVSSSNDTTPPTVAEVNPAPSLTNVPTNAQIQIEFSKEISPDFLSDVQLLIGATPVPATVSINTSNPGGYSQAINTVVTITPTALLSESTTYTISVSGVQDVQGNPIASTYTSQFTTNATGVNLTPPTLISITPANGATGAGASNVKLVFSAPMNQLTFDAANTWFLLELNSTSAVVQTTLSWSADGKTVTMTPTSPLTTGTTYKVYVYYPYLTDLAGNALAAPSFGTTSTFTQ
jgi:hypothetical protein